MNAFEIVMYVLTVGNLLVSMVGFFINSKKVRNIGFAATMFFAVVWAILEGTHLFPI